MDSLELHQTRDTDRICPQTQHEKQAKSKPREREFPAVTPPHSGRPLPEDDTAASEKAAEDLTMALDQGASGGCFDGERVPLCWVDAHPGRYEPHPEAQPQFLPGFEPRRDVFVEREEPAVTRPIRSIDLFVRGIIILL